MTLTHLQNKTSQFEIRWIHALSDLFKQNVIENTTSRTTLNSVKGTQAKIPSPEESSRIGSWKLNLHFSKENLLILTILM